MVGEHNLARLAHAAVERHGERPVVWFEGTWHHSGDLHVCTGCAQVPQPPSSRPTRSGRAPVLKIDRKALRERLT